MDEMNSTIAAERILYAVSPDGAGKDIVLTVGVPIYTQDRGWACKASVGFVDSLLTIYGADAWQALQLSMHFIARRVGHLEEEGWQFYWEKDGDRAYAASLAIDAKFENPEDQTSFEATMEDTPFTPEQETEIRQIVLDRAPGVLLELENSQSETEEFAHLPGAAAAAFHLGRFDDAKKLAERALALAPLFQENWNFGNAIHLGHTVLGLLALEREDLNEAVEELIRSGDTPGSPQLGSFGPTMHLVKEILKRGQTEPAIAYLKQCRRFWNMGGTWLDVWERKIMSGQIPNCFQHSYA